jgi:hypothetical protein
LQVDPAFSYCWLLVPEAVCLQPGIEQLKFEELNDLIPYAMGGKEKVLSMSPYDNITLLMPGRHAKDTTPKGGDFVVCVSDRIFRLSDHQFKHNDIFDDVEVKRVHRDIYFFMRAYLNVVSSGDPLEFSPGDDILMPGMEFTTFLCAAQCLAVAEHRRYAQYENKFGGRYLPFRFSAGVAEGLWNAEEASWLEKKGRPGVEQLEKERGVPFLTQELFDDSK